MKDVKEELKKLFENYDYELYKLINEYPKEFSSKDPEQNKFDEEQLKLRELYIKEVVALIEQSNLRATQAKLKEIYKFSEGRYKTDAWDILNRIDQEIAQIEKELEGSE